MNDRLKRFLDAAAKLTDTSGTAQNAGVSMRERNDVADAPAAASESPAANTADPQTPARATSNGLSNYPPPERWDDWVEYDPEAWPKRRSRRYMLVPTVCFNCESGCGLLGYVDKETLEIQKFEGNPLHPGSRGRNCAKGPATHNQVYDPERVLYPLKRVGARGEGKWKRVTWDEVLDDLATRIRTAFEEERRDEVMYHVGRPGHDGVMDWILNAWGGDHHNSHTNVCSSGARAGYTFWMGFDRPSPDHSAARVIFLISSHLETGHYFNPHAQRIMEGKNKGATLIVLDTRLSNTASRADYWLSPWPGSEAAMLLAIANHLIATDQYDREFVKTWVNWEQYLAAEWPGEQQTFETFEAKLKEIYAEYTFDYAEQESGVDAEVIRQVADEVANCEGKLATHNWRSASSSNLGGWQVARCLWFLNVLTGAIGVKGGTSAAAWDKFVPRSHTEPAANDNWNELLWPREYPLSFYEMSYLLPHLLKEGRGTIDTYFTRVYNPVWTNPDGMSWMEVLTDESKVGMHVCLTPTWSETAWFADYVLPMGHAPERYDVMSQETHAGSWIAFRQPVRRVALEKLGEEVEFTYEANPGEVWEETELWIELSWRVDPDGDLGIRQHFESPYRPGEKITVKEYFRWMFENAVPGLPEAAEREGLTPFEYMQTYGAFEIRSGAEAPYTQPVDEDVLRTATEDPDTGVVYRGTNDSGQNEAVGVRIDDTVLQGFNTPSRKLELYSQTMHEWGWPEYALPTYIKSHVHPSELDRNVGEHVLLSTFRLPTLIHTRSGNSKWLYEISHKNPLWIHPQDAGRLGLTTNDLVRVTTEIGYYVITCWVTEAIRPGVVACSHHMGRWRLQDTAMDRWSSALVDLEESGDGEWQMRTKEAVKPFQSDDPDSSRIWWTDIGVHQNLTFPVHPDPISGMHCWHQKVTVEPAHSGDRNGDIFVDTQKAHAIYKQWLALARPADDVSPDGTRRPFWLPRPFRPTLDAYRLDR